MTRAREAPGDKGKRAIKKLTKDKIEEFRAEIEVGRGVANLASRGMEAIVSLEGLRAATKLDLSHNKLTKLSDLKRVPNVTMLKLTANQLNGEVRAVPASGRSALCGVD